MVMALFIVPYQRYMTWTLSSLVTGLGWSLSDFFTTKLLFFFLFHILFIRHKSLRTTILKAKTHTRARARSHTSESSLPAGRGIKEFVDMSKITTFISSQLEGHIFWLHNHPAYSWSLVHYSADLGCSKYYCGKTMLIFHFPSTFST